jgi:hypothetical protein
MDRKKKIKFHNPTRQRINLILICCTSRWRQSNRIKSHLFCIVLMHRIRFMVI